MATFLNEPVDEQRHVSRGGVRAWTEEPTETEQHDQEEQEEEVTTISDEQEHEQETTEPTELSPEEISLEWAVRTRCFGGFEGKRMTYLNTTQLTCSNVMSTVVTSRPIDTSTKRRNKIQQQPLTRSNQETSTTTTTTTTTKTAMHVYAQACHPKKIKKPNGKYQAQLPSFRRSLPALPVPVNRLHQELVLERDTFMKQLYKERDEKRRLDNWAATKIQACYRGFRARPRVVTYKTRQKLNTLASLRLDLTEMGDSLKPTILNATPSGDARPTTTETSVSPWRKEIQSRAGKKRHFRARNEHMHHAATLIQASIKRFLARCAYARLLARHYDEVYLVAVTRIQSVFRGFRLRAKIMAVVAKLQNQAVIQIQSLIRGIQARERVLTLTFERKCEQLRRTGRPLQFTLPSRTPDIVRTSSLRRLFEHRTVRHRTAFKSPLWHEERMYLRIYKVAIKLNVRRQWLLRLNMAPPTTRQRKKRGGGLTRQSSGLSSRQSSSNLGTSSGRSTPSSPSNGRRRPEPTSGRATTPLTSARPASPTNWQSRTKA